MQRPPTRGPRRMTDAELERCGIANMIQPSLDFRCLSCGSGWNLAAPPRGERLPNGWWHCPHGCNVKGVA